MPSQYPQNVVTKNGLAMIAESVATRKNLIFTRVVVGDGDATGRNFNEMTGVISPKMELPVTSGVNEGNGQYLITATLSNNTLNVGFFPREVGLYAKVDGKTEMLYSYTNGGNNVGYVPDKTTPIDSEIYKIRTVIGNAKNITVNMSDSTFVTKGELDKYVAISSGYYIKDANKTNTGLSLIKGDNTSKVIDFITANYNDSDTNKVLNLSTLKGLLGQGAIVASKLDDNGYAKFANGLIIQWGVIRDVRVGTTLTLPIRVSAILSISGNDENTNTDPCILTFNNFTNTSFNVYGRRFGSASSTLWGRYICIGKA